MPTPKASTPILVGVRVTVPDDVGFETLKPYIKGKQKNLPSKLEIEKYDKIIRDAVGFYVGSVNATPVITMTERRSKLTRINTAARKLLAAIEASDIKKIVKWNIGLYKIWTSLDASTKAVIYRHFNDPAKDSAAFANALRYSPGRPYPDNFPALLKAVIKANKDLALVAAPVVNPMLVRLVQELAPVWVKVTGRSLKRVSIDPACMVKKHLFADWVCSLVADVSDAKGRSHALSSGSISDVLKTRPKISK
jgi:hypothetical protein